jgi:hypothetical protein
MGSKATKAVRNVWARLVVQDLEKRGIDAAGGLRNAGLGAFALADEEGWIPFVKHSAFLDFAADRRATAARRQIGGKDRYQGWRRPGIIGWPRDAGRRLANLSVTFGW